ncbi:hypothetical protein [Bradyrhizobium brasilense]|uniref:hypothetical protein n=1 Tax=Bradyrhizobium brasilense TaxID=1419277 RepID=UPI001E3684FC|nr:hypothetical protein [Bradyrhizobium brasilense]MCC8974951.1 hypothetical protein [Bradyrhizobium brasilense]
MTASVAGLLLCMGLFFDILAARSCDSAWAAKQGRFGTIWAYPTGVTGRISLLLAQIALYSAPSHTETWLKRPSGGNRAIQARLLTRFRRNQPENYHYVATRFFYASVA